jgi:hypothetical protein
LNREFLWVSQIARTTIGVGYGGQALGNRVVRWERMNNRILLRSVSYEVVADRSQPIAIAVEAANNATIVMAFDVEAFGKDDSAIVDVTRLFTTDVPECSARARRVGYFSVRQMDYGQDEHRAPERRYIARYRLEKRDPSAARPRPTISARSSGASCARSTAASPPRSRRPPTAPRDCISRTRGIRSPRRSIRSSRRPRRRGRRPPLGSRGSTRARGAGQTTRSGKSHVD